MDLYKGTITRRIDSVMDGLEGAFASLYTKSDFEHVLAQLEKAGARSNRPSILKKLFDMLDACGVSYETGQDNAYYEKLVEGLDIPADYKELEDKMLASLYEQYREYPSPTEYLDRIVERLRFPEDPWKNDTLRVKILKQFVKYGNCLTYEHTDGDGQKKVRVTIYGGRNYIVSYLKEKLGKKTVDIVADVNEIDDDVFLVLDEASKEQKKPTGKYGLLKMVNDLAQARFRAEGATKRSLYLFAMVYGMTYYSGDEEDRAFMDYRTDMELNLFRDYYANNLIRFLADSYKGHQGEFERDPSGQGINYKNFAEMIYLYYISKPDLSPQEKIRLSDEMIERVRIYGLDHPTPVPDADTGNTAYYRQQVRKGECLYSEDILGLSDTEFEAYLCKYYNCNTKPGKYTVAPMQLEGEQNTAYQIYLSLWEDLKNYYGVVDTNNKKEKKTDLKKQGGKEPELKDCNYGLWITDVEALEERDTEEMQDQWPDFDQAKYADFLDLLAGVDSFMKDTTKKQADTVTRTSIIVLYYYYYNAKHEQDNTAYQQSFEDVFNEFKYGIDERLDAAYYQPFSSKNIFDMLVAFSAYAYLHM